MAIHCTSRKSRRRRKRRNCVEMKEMGVKSQNEAFSLARSCRNVVTERVEASPSDGTVGSAVGFIVTFIGIICAIQIRFKLGTFDHFDYILD